jgi:hypothetical protein
VGGALTRFPKKGMERSLFSKGASIAQASLRCR